MNRSEWCNKLSKEIERNKELLELYQSIGVEGKLGAILLTKDIRQAEEEIKNGTIQSIEYIYNILKHNA